MNFKKTFLMALCLSPVINSYSQQSAEISVPKEVETRLKVALQKADQMPVSKYVSDYKQQAKRKIIMTKCLKTLYHNYRSAYNDILHESIVPSPTTFNGLWAWDSWKHAYALAPFDKELAENSIRAIFDYQDSDGMVPDCIRINKQRNNLRNTKPPLAAWAVYQIYVYNKDLGFVKEIYPKLLKFHYWWYSHRDYDRNGLCEYGSTDGSLQAARWESGWDNAIRFDGAIMLKTNPRAFSMNVESVDLNCYLYLDKLMLNKLALILGDQVTAKKMDVEKDVLKTKIQQMFFDKEAGFFYDIRLENKSFIKSKEASGWLPLYTRVATKEQAKQVRNEMLNKHSFNTFIPLPTASKDNPEFSPEKGYWRGPVWLDQFYFGYVGLKNYGYEKEANLLFTKLINNAEGLLSSKNVLRENYNPDTGSGLGAKNFGWSAACLLMMLTE